MRSALGQSQVKAASGSYVAFLLAPPASSAVRRFLHDARGHVLKPVVLDAAEVPEHPGHRPVGRHDPRLPGLLRQPLDDLQHRVALMLQEAQEHARLIVLVHIPRRR
jgi:hypothetical protein